MMRISPRGCDLVKSFEGCRLVAYQDSGGVWTIGWGRTNGVSEGQTITQAQADAWFQEDINRFAAGVDGLIHVPVTQDQFDALVSLAYNIGMGVFAQSTLLKMLNSGDWDGAADQFAVWCHVMGAVLPGLVHRRTKEAALFRGTINPAAG